MGGLSVGSWLRVREEAASTTKPHDTVRTEDPAAGRGSPVKGSGDTCQSDNCHFHQGQGRGKVLLSNGRQVLSLPVQWMNRSNSLTFHLRVS